MQRPRRRSVNGRAGAEPALLFPNGETRPVQEEGEELLWRVPSSITKLRHKKEDVQQ